MAPSYLHTQTYITCDFTYSAGYYINYPQSKPETKKERIQRIAEERRLVSQKLFNKRMNNTDKIIQRCKPQHRHLLRKVVNSCR